MTHHTITARAHANIALAKYWGKANVALNTPAVPSISITLQALHTTTTVAFDASLTSDVVSVNGVKQHDKCKSRVCELLERVRTAASIRTFATVTSENNFPTAAGLASSASAFAALALAAVKAAQLDWNDAAISDLARRSSASAGRSIFGGFVRLPAGNAEDAFLAAEPIAPADHWDLQVIVAVVSDQQKRVGSTDGMMHTQRSSPYFDAWCAWCPSLATRIEQAIAHRDFEKLGTAAEQSALAMHASAMAAAPGVVYFEPATISLLHEVRAMRCGGVPAYATMDAGPNVKIITTASHTDKIVQLLQDMPGVQRTMVSPLGGPAVVLAS